jgi:hypothetical protein
LSNTLEVLLFSISTTQLQILLDIAIQGVTTSASSGVVLFSTGQVGNDTIEYYCSIGDGITPTNAIYSAGTSVGTDNSNITISNNNIYNYFSATASSNGIFIGSNSSAITNNKFYQATRTSTENINTSSCKYCYGFGNKCT